MNTLLLQTTIEGELDDWHVARFSRLCSFLSDLKDAHGRQAFRVLARNRCKCGEPDPMLSKLDELDVDQLWLLAVDVGNGLAPDDCAGIGRFRQRAGR